MPAKDACRALMLVAACALAGVTVCAQVPEAGKTPAFAAPPSVDPAKPDAAGTDYLEDSAQNISTRAMLDRAIVSLAGEHTLSDALISLRDQSHINITINWPALLAAGIDKNTPVSLTLTRVSLTNALRILFNETGINVGNLGYAIDDGILVVSTREDLNAREYQVVRMFNVRDLVEPPQDKATQPATAVSDPAQIMRIRDDRINSLVDIIKATVEPDSWRSAGGTVGAIREFDEVLIVTQTNDNQRCISHLLSLLRATRAAGPGDANAEYREDSAEDRTVLSSLDHTRVSIGGYHRLAEVLDALRDKAHGNMTINWSALQTAGVDRNSPGSVALTDVPLAKALRASLDQATSGSPSLDFTVDGGIIVVSTKDDLDSPKYEIMRAYNARDLIDANLAAHPFGVSNAAANTEGCESADPALGMPPRGASVESLTEAIKTTVAPDSWREYGGQIGAIREFDGILIVSQSNNNQHAVARFLAQLRAARDLGSVPASTQPAARPAP